jgi:valyl-tRNA synthetase
VVLKIEDDVKKSFLEKNETCIKKLAKVNNLSFVKEYRKSAEESIYVGSGFEIYARVAELINIEKEKEKIQKEIERLTKQIENISAKLSNPSFLEKAPLEVIEREQKKLDDWTEELKKLKSSLSELTGKSL